ncbi:hypothetical protein BJY52DRAFT_271118 [Lactarius psammicola]|nr:hypothetical protein BJY52DRAFT_271118 [Lactarius psammicola]
MRCACRRVRLYVDDHQKLENLVRNPSHAGQGAPPSQDGRGRPKKVVLASPERQLACARPVVPSTMLRLAPTRDPNTSTIGVLFLFLGFRSTPVTVTTFETSHPRSWAQRSALTSLYLLAFLLCSWRWSISSSSEWVSHESLCQEVGVCRGLARFFPQVGPIEVQLATTHVLPPVALSGGYSRGIVLLFALCDNGLPGTSGKATPSGGHLIHSN